ncbi:DUF5455 family protein [Massilia sp. BJB1822]|uniref:DUF5455 family protein n=1 Tax=Massilia sp. BJB1822 TaxID=2744470 RepID=UPI001593A67E|nr:DUF5455 family protein [Massilia sp. BJB1822]NVD97947.1 DUF5455 family protein [Massilia sp. BJB1822]
MPLLATLIVNLFAGIVTFLAKYITQRVAITLAIAAAVTALFVGLYAATRAIIATAVTAAAGIGPMFGAGVSMVISPHSAAMLSAYVVFWSLCELYKWKVSILSLWSKTI